jgi:hypothetical protein
VRLCDCPGLVCPSTAGMELQVLGGVIPIQNTEIVSQFVFERVPVEKILKLASVTDDTASSSSRLSRPSKPATGSGGWTTDDILSSFASAQSFITAKAGRPDVSRAGAAILRLLHPNSIAWAFRPLGDDDQGEWPEHEGIWLVSELGEDKGEPDDAETLDVEDEEDEDEEQSEGEGPSGRDDDDDESSGASSEVEVTETRGAFDVLAISDPDNSSEEEERGGP